MTHNFLKYITLFAIDEYAITHINYPFNRAAPHRKFLYCLVNTKIKSAGSRLLPCSILNSPQITSHLKQIDFPDSLKGTSKLITTLQSSAITSSVAIAMRAALSPWLWQTTI